MEIKEMSYKDERLGFFADQRKLVQKRYDRLEKQIKPDEPYTSERREFLSDLGRELSFYNDVIEMLENDVVPKSEYDNLKMQFDALDCECDRLEKAESEKYDKFIEAKQEVAMEIFEEIERNIFKLETPYQTLHCIDDGFIAELKKKYTK